MTCHHGHWTIMPTGSWMCVGCGADIAPRPAGRRVDLRTAPGQALAARRPGPGTPTRRSRGTTSSEPSLSRRADARVSLSGSLRCYRRLATESAALSPTGNPTAGCRSGRAGDPEQKSRRARAGPVSWLGLRENSSDAVGSSAAGTAQMQQRGRDCCRSIKATARAPPAARLRSRESASESAFQSEARFRGTPDRRIESMTRLASGCGPLSAT
jgi:hypothetical protein